MAFEINALLKDDACEVFYAPFDVRLGHANATDQDITDVVQPDILVVCDPEKLDERGCKGAPDWVIEITSPGTASRDHIAKRKLYEQYCVKEYWIVQPVDRVVMVYRLEPDGCYARPDVFGETDAVPVEVIPGLVLDLKRVFPQLPLSLSTPVPPRIDRERKI
jgi:Uma2 family endonuclease